jgi:membrane fusion protein (multidrug efflux system)
MSWVKNRMRWIAIMTFAVALGLLIWGISYRNQTPVAQQPGMGGPPALPVEALPVRLDTVIESASAIGTLDANESVVIRSEIAGRVGAIRFQEGQFIKKGEILLDLDPTEFQAQVAQIKATVELNRMNFERAKQLHKEELISQQGYDEIETKLKESQASLALAQARLDKTTIRAPFGGRLGLRQVSLGDYVQPGQTVVNLEDLSSLKVDFRIPEIYLVRVKTGQRVDVQVDAFPDRAFSGKIYAIDPRIEEASRTILIRARIPNPDSQLRPGMFARVSIVLGERANAILIPEQAIVPMGQDSFVFRVVDGKAALTKIKIGLRRVGEVEILEGLTPKDTVVTSGQMKIRDGATVMILGPAGEKQQAPSR